MAILKENKFLVLTCSVMLLLWAVASRVAINTSESLPKGIYVVIHKNKDRVQREDIVLFYEEDINRYGAERGYIRSGQAIGKRVRAVGGDSIRIGPAGSEALGRTVSGGAPSRDSKGREMERFFFDGVVPKNSVFLTGDVDGSYDSRYFGFVSKDNITAVIQPVLTW